ncbi:hypothetical protein [Streptomyces sp. MBT27]|uniref:hypothetical protein n=1 Tax=Streptomyces sp. MBT27 TaxID=1488356 RepID=UPI001422F082|nr:hypothetical protein [Streptomyces sp. MBT27]
MTSIRLMDSDPGKARRTAAAVRRALEASPEVVVSNASEVPNRRDGGVRVFMEVLLLEPAAAPNHYGQDVTVERADGQSRRGSSRRSLRGDGRRALP